MLKMPASDVATRHQTPGPVVGSPYEINLLSSQLPTTSVEVYFVPRKLPRKLMQVDITSWELVDVSMEEDEKGEIIRWTPS